MDIEAELVGLRASEHMQDERSPALEPMDVLPGVLPDGPPLRFGLVAYPDSAIMAAVMKNLFREGIEIMALEPEQELVLAQELAQEPAQELAQELALELVQEDPQQVQARAQPLPLTLSTWEES